MLSKKVCPSWGLEGQTWTSVGMEGAGPEQDAQNSLLTAMGTRMAVCSSLGVAERCQPEAEASLPHDAEQSDLYLHWAGIEKRNTAPRWGLEGGKQGEKMLFLGSGSWTEKGQSLHGSNRGTSQERIFLLIGARSCGGTRGCQRSSKADTLNKDTPAGQVPGKLSKSVVFILLQTNTALLLPPEAQTLPAASPLFLGPAGRGDH